MLKVGLEYHKHLVLTDDLNNVRSNIVDLRGHVINLRGHVVNLGKSGGRPETNTNKEGWMLPV